MKKTLALAAMAAALTVAAGAARADRLSWAFGVNVAPGVTTVIGNGGQVGFGFAAPVYAR